MPCLAIKRQQRLWGDLRFNSREVETWWHLETMTTQNHRHHSRARESYFPKASPLNERGVTACSSQGSLCIKEIHRSESKSTWGSSLEDEMEKPTKSLTLKQAQIDLTELELESSKFQPSFCLSETRWSHWTSLLSGRKPQSLLTVFSGQDPAQPQGSTWFPDMHH